MNRLVFKVMFAALISAVVFVPAFAQRENDVAHWLDRDTTLLVNIDDVSTIYEKIKALDLFSNPRFIKAISMLSDERFPVVDYESGEQILVCLEQLESLTRKIEQITFVVHEIDENKFHWSLFIRAQTEVLDQVQEHLRGIDGHLTTALAPKKNENSKQDKKASESSTDQKVSRDIRWGNFQRTDPWLILSNHSSFLDALPDRIGDEKFRSLSKSRKYRAINKYDSPLNDGDGLITAYGNPDRMRYLVPHVTKTDWSLGEIDEMPAFGMKWVFPESNDGELPSGKSPEPVVLVDVIVKFTQPAVGQAKILENYRAVEIPPLAVKPVELLAFARDETAIAKEWVRTYEEHHGPRAADVFWRNYFDELGIDYPFDGVLRRDAFCEMRFVDEVHDIDRPGIISLERVNEFQVAQRYVEKVVQYAIKQGNPLAAQPLDGFNFSWSIPEERFNGNSGRRGLDRTRHARNDFYNCWHDAYFLTDQWWVQGDMPAAKDELQLLATGEGQDHAQPIRDLVEDLTRRLRADHPPLMVKYYTKDAWQENLNNIEQRYANANSNPVKFKIVQGDGEGIRLISDPDSEDSAKPIQGTFSLELAPPNKESGKGKPQSMNIQLSNLQSLQLMMPMRLAKRNEDGHRIPLKKREDLQTAIRVMILKSISETFPRQLFVYTRNDQHIRIMMGAYPDEAPDDDREKNE